MIGIIDYDAGNIKSVERALAWLNQESVVSRDAETLLRADRVVLPGVGSFGDAMEKLRAYGLVEVIRECVDRGTPLLGICLGLQLLFESSEESPGVEGLQLLDGRIVRIPSAESLKVPHIGWNNLSFPREGRLFTGVGAESAYVYFVHSYYLQADDRDIVTATTEYGVKMDVSVEKGNLFACQFHPEKSSDPGMQILRNFIAVPSPCK